MRHRSMGVLLACSCLWPAGAWAEVALAVVSTAPSRAHLVAPGTATTFVVSARNTAGTPAAVSLTIEVVSGAPGAWQASLAPADAIFRPVGTAVDALTMTLAGGQTALLVARLDAGRDLAEGAEARALVRAWVDGADPGSVALPARVRNRAKAYYVAIDGCGPRYLALNRTGTLFDGTGERLMPRAWSFAERGARMAAASSVLPAITDPNHSAALTGSWAGTLGIHSVRTHYLGLDQAGHGVVKTGSRDLLRWGSAGERVQSVFDVAKDAASGGDPSAFTAVVSGKNWLAELFRDPAVDLVAHGARYPVYVPAPRPYRLGDPPSDPDAEQDREGTNLGIRPIKHLFSPEARLFDGWPSSFPEDRWVAEAAVRVVQAEDPDVLYVNLADADTAQHVFGAADRPSEWDDRGTPGVLWDDDHVFNRNANRDPVLDVVHEADWDLGLVLDALLARQALDRSFVVLLSDHGLNTVLNTAPTVIDPGQVLLQSGVGAAEVEWIGTWGESGSIALADPAQRARVEAALEAYEMPDPTAGTLVKPFVVVNREEMDSGVDLAAGLFAADGVPGNRRGALYSEWSIDEPNPDNTKVRWPDLFFFTRRPFHTVPTQSSFDSTYAFGLPFQGDHGSGSSADVILAVSGPGIRPGVYATAATLADIAPTLYHLWGVAAPANVDGRALAEILDR